MAQMEENSKYLSFGGMVLMKALEAALSRASVPRGRG
jgi:hypothetical protein